jgi:hypothetical protein
MKLQCPYADCGKFYGSEGSLNLHIKIKHNGGNKTERERLAVRFAELINLSEGNCNSIHQWEHSEGA